MGNFPKTTQPTTVQQFSVAIIFRCSMSGLLGTQIKCPSQVVVYDKRFKHIVCSKHTFGCMFGKHMLNSGLNGEFILVIVFISTTRRRHHLIYMFYSVSKWWTHWHRIVSGEHTYTHCFHQFYVGLILDIGIWRRLPLFLHVIVKISRKIW